jgi:hypothetical protein
MISDYHKKYQEQSDDRIDHKIDAKKQELIAIKEAGLAPRLDNGVIDVCVLGCGDRRFVDGHRRIFSEVYSCETNIVTLDIAIEHLREAANVIQHDITNRLPNGPYDVTYGHVVLKFIPSDKQWDVVENSVSALKPGGIAIHILDEADYSDPAKTSEGGYSPVDLGLITKRLEAEQFTYKLVPIEYGKALVIVSK